VSTALKACVLIQRGGWDIDPQEKMQVLWPKEAEIHTPFSLLACDTFSCKSNEDDFHSLSF
jgi:hypothetical protein